MFGRYIKKRLAKGKMIGPIEFVLTEHDLTASGMEKYNIAASEVIGKSIVADELNLHIKVLEVELDDIKWSWDEEGKERTL